MGKGGGKNQPRVKGNQQPASSSRAAELLSSSTPALNTAALGGFAQFAQGIALPTALPAASSQSSASDEPDLTDLNPDLVVILKKLSKRDPTTKLRALEELDAYIKESDLDTVCGLIGIWVRMYARLAIEVDRRVRAAAQGVLNTIVKRVGKRLGKYVRDVVPVWVCSFFDVNREVAKVASEAFQSAFPPNRRKEVLVFCQAEIIKHIEEYALHKTPEMLSDPRFTSKEDMGAKYTRVVSESLYALAYLYEELDIQELEKCRTKYDRLLDQQGFWQLTTHEQPTIRKAAYRAFTRILNGWSEMLETRVELVSKSFLAKAFNNMDPSTHGELWDAVLSLMKKYPQSWLLASQKKPLVGKLWHFLGEGAYGSASITYPSLVVLMGCLPAEVVDSAQFYPDLFLSLWKGLSSPAIDRVSATSLVQAYVECLLYSLAQLNRKEPGAAVEDLKQRLILRDAWRLVSAYLLVHSPNSKNEKAEEKLISSGTLKLRPTMLCSTIATLFQKLSTMSLPLFEVAWEELMENVLSGLQSEDVIEKSGERVRELLRRMHNDEGGTLLKAKVDALAAKVWVYVLDQIHAHPSPLLCHFLYCLTVDHPLLLERSEISSAFNDFVSTTFFVHIKNSPLAVAKPLVLLLLAAPEGVLEKGEEKIEKCIEEVAEMEAIRGMEIMRVVVNEFPDTLLAKGHSSTLDAYVFKLFDSNLSRGEHNESSTEIITTCLGFGRLSPDTGARIIAKLAYTLESTTSEDAAVLYALQIVEQSLRICGTRFLLSLQPAANIVRLLANIFLLSSRRGADNEIDTEEGDRESIEAVSQTCWSIISETIKSTECADVKMALGRQVTERVLHELTSPSAERYMKPDDAALQIAKMISGLELAEEDREEIIRLALGQNNWAQLAQEIEAWRIDPSLVILEPLASIAIGESGLPLSPTDSEVVSWTQHVKLALFVADLISSLGHQILLSPRKDRVKENWVLFGLLFMREACIDESAMFGERYRAAAREDLPVEVLPRKVEAVVESVLEEMLDQSMLGVQEIVKRFVNGVQRKMECLEDDGVVYLLLALFQRAATGLYSARTFRCLFRAFLVQAHLESPEVEPLISLLNESASDSLPLPLIFVLIECLAPYLHGSPSYKLWQNELASKLAFAGPSERFDTETGWRRLLLLNASVPEEEAAKHGLFLPGQRCVQLLNGIKGWYEETPGEESEQVHKEILRLLRHISSSVLDVASDSHWRFMLDRVEDGLATSQLPRRYQALKLLQELRHLAARAGGENIETMLHEQGDVLARKTLDIFLSESDASVDMVAGLEGSASKVPISEPRQRYFAILSDLVLATPKRLLLDSEPLGSLCELLGMRDESLQKCAHHLLTLLVHEYSQDASVRLELQAMSDTRDSEAKTAYSEMLPPELLSIVLTLPEHAGEGSEHATFAYFLAWILIFEHFERSTFALKTAYTAHLRDVEALTNLLYFLFDVLNITGKPFDMSLWEVDTFYVQATQLRDAPDQVLPLMAAHVYFKALRYVPSLVRAWWMDLKNRQLSIAVENFTEKHNSQQIIRREMAALQRAEVRDELEDEHLTVRVSRAANEVTAGYRVDEATMEVMIRLPQNYPLRQAEVEGLQRVGVTEARWRAWILATSAIITYQNGTIIDAISLFKRNVRLHFDGVEDCTICYSIINVQDRSLPGKQCRTCKNRFHASCLYKWFRSSNSSSCPLCRTLF
ncbi:uncharacterized protein VTP21DRAFT_3803 [Calcarisporiella thermophila]|uniref:uncharacterized protein n=1 Tax=Calcarisporiella thermophila TaxID=911321 RepID=UPI003741ECC8